MVISQVSPICGKIGTTNAEFSEFSNLSDILPNKQIRYLQIDSIYYSNI